MPLHPLQYQSQPSHASCQVAAIAQFFEYTFLTQEILLQKKVFAWRMVSENSFAFSPMILHAHLAEMIMRLCVHIYNYMYIYLYAHVYIYVYAYKCV